jgi:hypothetical protein
MSCVILLQSTAAKVSVYVELTAGGAATGLLYSDVAVDLQKAGGSYVSKDLTPPRTNATAVIGIGANGAVNITADGSLVGDAGNAATVEVVDPSPVNGALDVTEVGGVITVTLAVAATVLDTAANTALLVAAAIDGLADFSAAHTGTGADSLALDEGPTAFTGGTDFWTEVGSGVYTVDLTATETDTLGNMYLRVTGATVKTTLSPLFISEAAPSPTATLPVATTLLFGYVLDAQGAPLAGAAVSAKVLATPSVGFSGTEGYVQGTSLVTTNTDASGFFQISLVTGSQVDFFIPSSNYRRTLEVPTTSQNVFDIP